MNFRTPCGVLKYELVFSDDGIWIGMETMRSARLQDDSAGCQCDMLDQHWSMMAAEGWTRYGKPAASIVVNCAITNKRHDAKLRIENHYWMLHVFEDGFGGRDPHCCPYH